MLKKNICLLLALIMIANLTACGHSHEFGDWEESKAATCTEKGEQIRRCTCGEIESKEIPAKGHTFGEWTIIAEATCMEDGKRERLCSVCGFCETEVIAATGHSFVPATVFYPKYCEICGITEGDPLGTIVSLGDEVSHEEYKFKLYEDITYRSSRFRDYNYNYYDLADGEIFLTIAIDYTNLRTKPVKEGDQDWITDIKLRYANKYEYDGLFIMYSNGINPLTTERIYFVYDVPESVKSDGEPIQATFTINGTVYSIILRE